MALTIRQSYNDFKSNLEITGLQKHTVSTRHKNVRATVERELTVIRSFLTGSYSRNTMIAPLSEGDIDVFIVLDPSYYDKNGQIQLLDKVKRVLKKTYPKTPKISRNGQAISISFTDFVVDVVPCFNRRGGGYLIPDSIGHRWIETDPEEHVQYMSTNNSIHNRNLKPIIKMIKCWNRTINHHFSSFHLEVMVAQILNNVTISDFPSGVRYFFDKGRFYVAKKNPDPSGYNNDVGSYINSQVKIDAAISRFATAYNRALKAEQYAKNGNINSAVNEWRKIFGNRFPSYG